MQYVKTRHSVANTEDRRRVHEAWRLFGRLVRNEFLEVEALIAWLNKIPRTGINPINRVGRNIAPQSALNCTAEGILRLGAIRAG